MIEKSTLKFLKELTKNNHKEWFDANRVQYENARDNVSEFVQDILKYLTSISMEYSALKPKDCMFRINRDVRFSKNKEPYKTNFGAYFSPGGKKSPMPGYYFHLEFDRAFLGGGIYLPEPSIVKKIRQEIDYQQQDFRAIIEDKKFVKLFGDLSQEHRLLNAPKEYGKDHPMAAYLRLKSWFAVHDLTMENITKDKEMNKIQEVLDSLVPLNQFLQKALSD